jgi:hypothetical protein
MDQQAPPPQAPPPTAPPSGWNPQPQPGPTGTGWVQPAAMAAARGPVTGLAKLGALVLLINGVLWTLFWGAVTVLGAAAKGSLDQFGGTAFGDAIGGAIVGVAIFFLVIAILELLVGIGSWMGKEWGRIGGIIYSLLFGVILLLGGLSALGARDTGTNTAGGALVILVFAIAYIYTLVVFAIRWRSRIA